MSRVRCVVTMFLLAAAGCATPSQLVQPGREFQLAVGETARIEGSSSRVLFRSVTDDSRCPVDVQCVWAGNAKILLTLSVQGKPDTAISINTGLEPRSAAVAGYLLRATGLSPAPRSGTAIPANGYVANFELSSI